MEDVAVFILVVVVVWKAVRTLVRRPTLEAAEGVRKH
jgi:hypothetical protein